jgi:hypothetical protein
MRYAKNKRYAKSYETTGTKFVGKGKSVVKVIFELKEVFHVADNS